MPVGTVAVTSRISMAVKLLRLSTSVSQTHCHKRF